MADHVHGGTEQHLVREVASFLSYDRAPGEVERRVECCRSERCRRKTSCGRLRNAVATPHAVATVDLPEGRNRKPGNALNMASELLESAALQFRVWTGKDCNLLDLLAQRHRAEQQLRACLRGEVCVHPWQLAEC